MWMDSIRSALTTLGAICALAAATEALFEGEQAGTGVRVVSGLSIALCVLRLFGSVLH